MLSKLQPHSLTVIGTIIPETMSLTISEKDTEASITLGPEAPAVSVGEWYRDEKNPGKGIVYRVKSVEQDYGRETRTVKLEHIVKALKDCIIFDELDPDDMGGTSTKVAAKKAIETALSYQAYGDWRLWEIEYPAELGYSFNGDSVYDAIETVCGTLADSCWEYDLTRYPFRLSIRKQRTEVTCEMRAGRNLTSVKRTVDTSRMYTRFYPIGYDDLHISGDYVSKNESKYGVVCKTETDTTISDTATLTAWARDKLNRHCEPAVTITISGLELADATGVAFDRLTLGTVCRVPLPEYGTTISERISKLQYSDKLNKPEVVTVTLANELADFTNIVKTESTSSSKGGRSAAKTSKEDHAWFTDEDTYVQMTAEKVFGKDESTGEVNWSRVATLRVDGEGIFGTVTETKKDVGTMQTKVEQHSDSIGLVVENWDKNSRKVAAGKITLAINKAGKSEASIQADHIKLTGKTHATDLEAEIAHLETLTAKSITTDNLSAKIASLKSATVNRLNVTTGLIGDGDSAMHLSDIVTAMQVVEDDGGYKLQYKKEWGDKAWHDASGKITFSNVTTLTASWSGGKYTVKAMPQNKTVTLAPAIRLDGMGQANFSAKLFDGNTDTGVSKYIYLTLAGSGAGSYVKASGSADGSTENVGQISVGSLYKPGSSELGGSNPTAVNRADGSWAYLGEFSRSGTNAYSYLRVTLNCRGTQRYGYFRMTA